MVSAANQQFSQPFLFSNYEQSGDVNRTLQQLCETAHKLFQADIAVMFSLNPVTGKFWSDLAVAGELKDPAHKRLTIPRPDGITHRVIEQKDLLVTDLSNMPNYQNSFTNDEDIQSFYGVALFTERSKPIGVLYLDFRSTRAAEAVDLASIARFREEATWILQRTWLIYRLNAAATIGMEINQGLGTVEMLYPTLKENIREILDISSFFMLGVLQPHSGLIDLYMTDKGRDRLLEDDELDGASKWVIKNRKSLIIQHLTVESECLPVKPVDIPDSDPDVESLVFVPLVLRNDVPLGVLTVQHPLPYAFAVEDIKILEIIANHVALALSNMRLFQDLEQLHDIGQLLTSQLIAGSILEMVTDEIRDVTGADLAILYQYQTAEERFALPPFVSGQLHVDIFPQPTATATDDTANLTIRKKTPVFAKDSQQLYTLLGGNPAEHSGSFVKRERIASTAAVPLHTNNTQVGVLFLNYRTPQRFDRPQQYFIQVLANYAAIAINNTELLNEEARRRIRQLEQLRVIDHRITSSLDLDIVLETILDIATEEIPSDEASILLFDSDGDTLRTVAANGRNAEFSKQQTIQVSEGMGITAWVAREGEPARVGNVRVETPWKELHIPVAEAILSELDAPIRDGDRVIGVINLESVSENAFEPHHEDFLWTLAGQINVAIQHARRFRDEKRRIQEFETLQSINKSINRSLDLKVVHDLIVDSVVTITGAEIGEIRLVDRATQELVLGPGRYPSNIPKDQKYERLPWDQGVTGWCVQNRGPALIYDTLVDERYIAYFQGMRSELAVPLIADRVYGVINLESPRVNAFSEGDLRIVEALAGQAVTGIRNAHQYERLQALHHVDEIIIRSNSTDDTLPEILKLGLQLTDARWGDIRLINSSSGEDSIIYAVVDENRKIEKVHLGQTPFWSEIPDKGIVRLVAESGSSFLSDGDIQLHPNYVGLPHIHAEVAVPLKDHQDTVIGVLNIESSLIDHFDNNDLEILTIFGSQAVIAIQNAINVAQAQRERERFRILHEVGQKLGSIGSYTGLTEAYRIILDAAEQHSQSQVIIRRYDIDTDTLITESTRQRRDNPPLPRIARTQGINGQVLRERRTIVIHDINNPPPGVIKPTPSDPETQTYVVTPIQIQESFYGTLTLSHTTPGHFQDADVELIEGLANELAITIHRVESSKARQEAEERYRAAEVMLSVGQSAFELAHRLGNDLGTVKSYINEITRQLRILEISDSAIDEALADIHSDVRKVLVFSQELKKTVGEISQTGTVQRPKAAVPVADLLEEARAFVPESRTDIHVNVDWDGQTPAVNANHQQVANILRNLVTNAVEAMPSAGQLILRASTSGRYILLEVSDTGIGIPATLQKRIFDLFYSTKGSSGFGLWSSKQYALANGGDLTVKSIVDQGATFTLMLPKAEVRKDEANV